MQNLRKPINIQNSKSTKENEIAATSWIKVLPKGDETERITPTTQARLR